MGNFKIVSPDQKKFKRVDAPGYTSGDILRLKVGANAGYKKYEEYLKRIQNEEYLTSDDLKGYEDAINSYTSKMDELRAYSQSMGHQFDDNEAWTQAKNSLTSQYKATRDYYSAFSDESQYKKALEDSKRYSYLQGLDLTALTAEIEGYRAEVEEHNDWLDDNVWAFFTAGERNKRLERIKELNETISTKQKEYNEAKNIQDWNTLSTINDTNFDNYVNIGKNSKNSLQLPIYSFSSNIKAETDRLKILAEHTTEEERNKYYYYVGKDETEKAERYLSILEDEARKRAGSDIATSVKNAGKLASTFYSVVVGLDSFTSGMADVTNLLRGKDANKISPIQYAGSEIREGLNSGWGVAYDVGQSIGNMLPSIALSVATGGAAIGTVAMGASAAGNAYSEMLRNGYSANQARAYGVLVGASEAALQYAIGGISPLGSAKGGVLSKATEAALSKVDKALARFAIEWGSSMASEAIEEGVQSILEPIFMSIATGEDINIDWEEVAYSALLGALTSGALEGALTIAGTVHSNYKTNVQMGGLSNKGAVNAFFKGNESGTKGFKGVTEAYKSGKQAVNENAKAYVNASLAIDPNNAHAQRMQSRLDNGKNVSGYQINRLAEANKSALSSKMKSAVEARLTELGEKGNVSKLADAIVKARTGEKLTSSEKALFKKSEFAEQVLNEGFNENTLTQAQATTGQAETTSLTENSPIKENATEGKISAVAKATMTDSEGNEVEVKPQKFALTESGEMGVEIDGGKVVAVSNVDFGDSDIGVVRQAAIDMSSRVGGFGVDTANVFVNGYNPESGQNAGAYIDGWISAYKFGAMKNPPPLSALAANPKTAQLTEEQRKTAYNFGRAFGNEKVATNKKSEGFTGEYTKRSYNSKQAELLSALPVEALQNAVDSNGAVSFNAIGLGGDTATQQKWIDAGLTYTEDGKTYVDENAVLDERDRRRNALKQEKIVSTESKNAENISKTDSKVKKGRVIFDGAKYGKTLNERQRASLKSLTFLAKALGKDIYVEKLANGDNGWYDPKDRSIHIDLYAGVEREALMLFVAAHELTHDIREQLPDKFNILADAIFEEYTKKYSDHVMEDLVEAKIDFLKEQGDITEDMTEEEAYDLAYEEVICDCCETLLVDSNAMESLSKSIYAKDKGLWNAIKRFFVNLVERIKAAYKDVIPDTEEGQAFRELGEGAERIKNLWVEAIVELSELGSDAKTDSGDVVNVIEDGQFYKVRGEDAVRLSNEVDLTLTQETVNGKKVPMVGFPLRYFDTYAKKAAKKGITLEKATVKHSYSSIAYSFFGDKKVTVKDFENGSYTETEGYKRYVENCLNNMRQTSDNFDEESARKEIEDSIAGIVKVAVAMKKAGYDILDNHAKRSTVDSKNRLLFSSLEPNSDYFTSSDISTICDKRINFAEIYDEIVRREEALDVPKGKRFFDNVDNYFILHKIMADKGLTQPCRECYVESMRKNLAPMANAFLKLMQETDPNNKANDQLWNKGQPKPNNTKLREKLLEAIDTEEYDITADKLTVEMLTTDKGLTELRLQAPLIYEAFNSFYGQSKPKMPKSATPFRFGELTALLTDDNGNISKGKIDKIVSTGGFRLQSYSDFQIQNFADVLQVIFEAGTLGLNGHAYTKVPAFLDATKGTNLKRNISIFMYNDNGQWKIDRNDSFPYELDKIYDIVKSDKQGNTSIIAVSQNEMMSAWLMANDNIGYFIPFHKSGLKMGTVRETIVKEDGREIKGYSGIKDHTRQQTEVWAKTTSDHKAYTKVKKGINIYEFWDFDNVDNLSKEGLIEKNVRAYIDACEEAGYLPKFREYVINNSKVLNAVLSYAKELGFVSQNASIDDISFEYKGYRIPYGYYKCLGDFGMFTPDGEASPIERLSLKDYNFDEAEAFFTDAETLRRNEILQQIANGEERERYRNSDMTTAEIAEEVQAKRNQVVDEVVSGEYKKVKHSHKASQKSDFSYKEIDTSYLDAVNRGDMVTAQRMVDEAAKEANVFTDERGKPIDLYHGTPKFGFTHFKEGPIFATSNPSIAGGYTANKGWGRVRQISQKYKQDDISLDTLIENAKNILETEVHQITPKEQSAIRDEIKAQADELAERINNAWTGAAVDAIGDSIDYDALSYVLTLAGSISENIDDIGAYYSVSALEHDIDLFDKYYPEVKNWFAEHRDELKDTLAWDMHNLIMGFDLGDFAIDARYKLLRSLDDTVLVSKGGGLVSQETVRENIERLKDVGAYHLYGVKGDNPLVIDAQNRSWLDIRVEGWDNRRYSTEQVAKIAREKGYTSVVIKNVYDMSGNEYAVNIPSDIYIFFGPNQVKSADTITYDDNGNIIPLSERFNPKNSDIRYQHRQSNGMKPRALLANALETAVNEEERNLLQTYRENIDKLNSEQEKLDGVMSEIDELQFKKSLSISGEEMSVKTFESRAKAKAEKNGINAEDVQFKLDRSNSKYIAYAVGHGTILEADKTFRSAEDNAKLKELYAEAKDISTQINAYDRELLKLQAMEPIKDVLKREKAMAYKKATEKADQRRKKATEGRNKTAERVAIKALKEKFIRMLSSPTDRQYVPESLVKAMVEVCQLIDTDTPLYKKDGSINKAQQARNEQIQKLLALRDEYANLAKHPDPMYKGEFDEEILQYLDELRTEYSGKPIADMTLVELKELRLTLRSIDETLRDARKLIGWGEAELVYDAGDRIIQEQQKITRDRKGKGESATKAALIDNTLSALRNVDRMSGYDANSPLNKAMREIELGNRKKNKFGMDAHKRFDEVISGKNVKKYEEAIYLPHGKEYIDKEGRKFRISKMQKMQAIMSYDRELANSKLHHVSRGGFTFADLGMLVKGKLSDAVDSKNAHSIMLGAEIAEEFRRELANDTWAQEYMKVAEEFFDVTAKNAINETNMTLKHRIIATGSKYIPYEVNKDFIVREINSENDIQQTISGYGMLKDLQEGASQPIIITGLNNVLERHIDQVSNIVGLAVPIRNFNKIWNVKASDGSTTVQEAIGRNWGNRGKQAITQAVKDVQGSRISHTPAIYKKIKSNVVGATFMLNGSVVMKQTGSLFSATAKMRWRNPVSMLANLVYTMANHKKIAKEVDAYTASAWMRRQGMSESELSDFMTEAKKRGIARLMSKLPAVINPTKWVMGKDYVVALSLWKYAKQDVAKKTGLEGEALLKATAEYYDDIIEHTQSMSDSLHRPEIQKSDNILSETFGMFKTDLYQGAGLLLDAAGAFKAHPSKENAKALAKAVTANLMSALWASMITSAFALLRYKVNRYRDDEDDELTAESWIEEQGAALASDLVGYIVPLFGSELTDIIMSVINDEPIETFDSFTLDAINNIVTAINRDDYTGIITTVCSMFGVPAANIKRVIEAVKLHAEDFANGELFEFEAGLTEPNSTRLYNAYIENDPDKIEKASRLYEDEKDIDAALRKALRENDPRIQSIITSLLKRDYKTSKTLSSEFLQEGHFNRELIEGAIEAEFNYVEDKIKEIRKLIESGKTEEIEGLYKKLKDRGYDLELIKKLI